MDADDLSPRPRSDDLVARLTAEDLDRLSRDELRARIAALEGEIARVRARIDAASAHMASADALFGRK